MSLTISVNSSPLFAIKSSVKVISIRLAGTALGYSVYEKLAEIINVKFPNVPTSHLPYIGLISGAFAEPQVLVIYAVALFILIPLQKYQTSKRTVFRKPDFMEEMGRNLKNSYYLPRMKEINIIRNALNKCGKRNVLIIGNPGSGKTSLIETIIQMKRNNDPNLHSALANKKFYKGSCADIMSNTNFRGQLEEKITALIRFAKKNRDAVFVFDEIHQFAMANSSIQGSPSILEFLKESLPDGEIAIIGMTTEEEFQKHIATNKALERRFAKIYLNAPTLEQSLVMLQERARIFQDKYPNIECPDEIYGYILHLIKPSDETSLIDQAVDLLDTAYSEISCESQRVITREIIEKINKDMSKDRDSLYNVPSSMYS